MYLAEEEVDENGERPQDQIVQPPDEGWNIRLFLAHGDGVTPNGRLETLCGRDQWSRRSGRRVDKKRFVGRQRVAARALTRLKFHVVPYLNTGLAPKDGLYLVHLQL